jgi:hypothetical protein
MTLSSPARLLLPAAAALALLGAVSGDTAAKPRPLEPAVERGLQEQISRIRRSRPMLNALGLHFLGASFSPRTQIAHFTFKLRQGIAAAEARQRLTRAARLQKGSVCRSARSLFRHGVSMNVTVLDSRGRNFSSYTFSRRTCR